MAGALLGSAGGCSFGVWAGHRAAASGVGVSPHRWEPCRRAAPARRQGVWGFLQEPDPGVRAEGTRLPADLLHQSREGRLGWGRGEGSSHKGPQSLLLPPGQRFHCGGKKKRRWVLHGFKAASSLLPVPVPPAERAGFSTLPPASDTLPSVTCFPLLFAPQTRK